MPFSHNGLKFTTGKQVFSQVNKYTLSYRFLFGNVQGCVFAKDRPVSLNWTDYIVRPANRDWACQTERCHTLSNKTSLQ